ncbi:RagB/SusD family nutrient uptake outer membrane protein [Aquiflexum sp.]|uniref:RagB/SusD family nutrient uptake outer membrane protein n=1 Tax=Aquiflexum sp. TaxID=1872584 RepID=UPI0035937947
MKNIKIYISMFLVFTMTSCMDEFIELKPISTVSTDALYKTDGDFQDAVTGIYSVFRTQYTSMWLYGDMRGDDSYDELVKGTAAAMDLFTINNDDNTIRNTWRNYYMAINRANTVISKIEEVDGSVVRNKDRHMGEAKFLRALAYFDMVRIFGDVPMIIKPISIEESYELGREKVATIYQEVIIKDLLDAETKLAANYSGADAGRATSGAAKSLLGKVYLTLKDFTKAEVKLKEVTSMGYALLTEYDDLFDYSKNEHHSEYIFDIEYIDGGLGLGNNFTNLFFPKNPPITNFYNINGGGDDANNPPRSLFALFPPGDKRKDVTAADGWVDEDGNFNQLMPAANASSTFTKKYLIPNIPLRNDGRANWKVIRYADVLLMLAEALNENGKTEEALGLLNQVRDRAGLSGYSGISQNQTRENIYLERRLELSFEGHRWFDLVRTGRALSTMEPYGMKPYMTVFPIPLSQIQLMNNPAIFPQNPGYD